MPMNNKLLHHPLCHFLLIAVLGALIYANSFGVPFVFDDQEWIARNETIRDLGNFLSGVGFESQLRRWVGYFSFAVNYRFGGLDVSGYHLVNLAVHLGTALLVYALVRLSFRTPFLAASRLAPRAGTVALLAALFFVAHPVQTQAVTYIFQRLASLCTFFYLLTLILYVRGRLGMVESAARIAEQGTLKSKRAKGRGASVEQEEPRRSRLPHLYLAGAFLTSVIAMFSKEIAFTLPLAVGLYEICFFRGPWRERLPALLPLLLTLLIVPVLVSTSGEVSSTTGTLHFTRIDISRWHYLLTQLPVIATYLRLFLLPINQNLDYDYPIYTTLTAPPVLFSLLLLTALFAAALYLFRRTRPAQAGAPESASWFTAPEFRLVAFGLFWFFLTLSVESFAVPLPDVIFEHRLYLPSIGLAVALAVALLLAAQATKKLVNGRLPLLLAAVAIIALGAATWQRNQVWQSEVGLWQDVVSKSPGKARSWYNLGTALAAVDRTDEAIAAFSRSVALDPQDAKAWFNLGQAYLLTNRFSEALPPLRAAVRLDPGKPEYTVNLSAALLRTGKQEEVVSLLEGFLVRFPDVAFARLNLGMAYASRGDLPAARRELANLQRLDPNLARALADFINRAGTP